LPDIERFIRDIPDFPKPGIVFKDITTLLADPTALDLALSTLTEPYLTTDLSKVIGIESRGFIFGAAMARSLGAGFVPIRKPGKLPARTRSVSYELEYGQDTIEIHEDAVQKGERVLLVDDLLATGGTMAAACELVDSLGAEIVGIAFLIELRFLGGREKLGSREIFSAIEY
tara:strand:- start:610 stop:1125 length:516 start_codon:yes stop_codon:yes gene_type:complete